MPLSKKTPGKDKAFKERRRQQKSSVSDTFTDKNVYGAGKKGKTAMKKDVVKKRVRAIADEKLDTSRGIGGVDDGGYTYRAYEAASSRARKGGVAMQGNGRFTARGGSSSKKSEAKRIKQSMDARPELKGKYKP